MSKERILQSLRDAEHTLRARGIMHAALFGSVARGENQPHSDIDILVDLDAEIVRTVYDYVGIKYLLAELVGGRVDVVDRAGLKARVRLAATADEIHAF